MIDQELLTDRLSRIRENLKHLKELGSLTREEFLQDQRNYGSASRMLQISIEACLDIGHHIISRREFRRPNDYKDIFIILGDENILPHDFSRSLVKMAKYRNRLVHLYWEITPEEVHEILQGPINDLEEYAHHIVKLLEK